MNKYLNVYTSVGGSHFAVLSFRMDITLYSWPVACGKECTHICKSSVGQQVWSQSSHLSWIGMAEFIRHQIWRVWQLRRSCLVPCWLFQLLLHDWWIVSMQILGSVINITVRHVTVTHSVVTVIWRRIFRQSGCPPIDVVQWWTEHRRQNGLA